MIAGRPIVPNAALLPVFPRGLVEITMPLPHWLALLQGIYFAATGVWPLVHMPSFLAVTGPKHDLWLVRTVGVVVAVVGAVLILAAVNERVTPEIALLGLSAAAGLGAVDVVYWANGTIPKVYLLDAVAEAVLVVAWVAVLTIK